MIKTAKNSRLSGRHILLILFGFFGLIGVVNAAFIYFAISTGPGEEKGASYEVGLRYNKVLAEERTQKALNWRHRSKIAEGEQLRISITDNTEAPVIGLAVSGSFGRPASDKVDRSLTFKEVDNGIYEAALGGIALEAGSCPSPPRCRSQEPRRRPTA